MVETKVCSGCKVEKHNSEYHKCSKKKTGIQSRCKDCMSKLKKERYWSNHDEELAKLTRSRTKPENVQQRKGYYLNNKDEYKDRYLKYVSNDDWRKRKNELSAQRYQQKREQIREKHKENYRRPEVKERIRERHHERKKQDIQYVIRRRLRNRLRHAIKAIGGNCKYKSAIELLGCDLNYFKSYIESLFTDGMSWEFVLSGKIHIDHKKACAIFDLTNLEDQKVCFHYTNLQPLWDIDNLKKNKYER